MTQRRTKEERIAAIDENLQRFSAGRSPKVLDVLLDSCGALFGLLVFLLLAWIISAMKRRKNSRESS